MLVLSKARNTQTIKQTHIKRNFQCIKRNYPYIMTKGIGNVPVPPITFLEAAQHKYM